MSRPLSGILQPSSSTASSTIPTSRPLNLTEELERLEQSITLTMQEIDRNFSQCHRIITHSILPIVDDYAAHSQQVCESVRFWKEFFEHSAQVTVGAYESRPGDEVTMTEEEVTGTEEESSTATGGGYEESSTTRESGDVTQTTGTEDEDRTITMPESDDDDNDHRALEDESILASMNLTGRDIDKARRPKSSQQKAGRPQQQQQQQGQQPRWANMNSPYDKLRKEMSKRPVRKTSADEFSSVDDQSMTPPSLPTGMSGLNLNDSSSSYMDPPTTPETIRGISRKPSGAASRVLDSSPPDSSSPYMGRPQSRGTGGVTRTDKLLHRAVDTNWRIQLTPARKTPTSKYGAGTTAASKQGGGKNPAATVTPKHKTMPMNFEDSSPMSSPEPPQMTTVFSPLARMRPPVKLATARNGGTTATSSRYNANISKKPKTPITMKKYPATLDPKTVSAKDLLLSDEFDDDDDDDDFKKLGFSPPVTMQFTLPPSKLMQTPAKQASRMLVDNILKSAGFAAGGGSEFDDSSLSGGAGMPSFGNDGAGDAREMSWRREFGGLKDDDDDEIGRLDYDYDEDEEDEGDSSIMYSPTMVKGREITDDF